MRAIQFIINLSISVSIVLAVSCKEEEEHPPDLEAISEDYCSIDQMCDAANFEVAYGDFEGCRADILMDFKEAKDVGDACFDATLAHLSCVGTYESCEEYDMGTVDCTQKSDEYFYQCLGGL